MMRDRFSAGDDVCVSPHSPWRGDFGDAVGTVQETSAKDGRCSVHFPTLKRYAQGWSQDDFDLANCGQGPDGAEAER